MSIQVFSFTVTCPAGTAKAAAILTNLTIPIREVREIEVRVPNGPNGEMGFALAIAGQNMIPFNPGEYVVTSDEIVQWSLTGYPTSGAWQVRMYNTGNYDHTIQIRFYVDLVDSTANAGGITLIPTADLMPTPPTTESDTSGVSLA